MENLYVCERTRLWSGKDPRAHQRGPLLAFYYLQENSSRFLESEIREKQILEGDKAQLNSMMA